ncbi:MAG: hypothetical protein HKP61_17270 [Dactylosporangium sp.]|nr:hypothetical protein [Dactylosporangium sp.]
MSIDSLLAQRQDSTQWYSGLGLVESIADVTNGFESGSWIDSSIGGVSASLEALGVIVDPLGSLAACGVSWLIEHCKPLSDALDWLAGDPDQITAFAQTWRNISGRAGDQAQVLAEAVSGDLARWTGAAATAYRAQAGEQHAALTGLGQLTDLIGAAVEGAGLLVALTRELVRDLIAEFVSILLVRLWEWLAEEAATLGLATPVVIAQVSSLVATWAGKIARLLNGVLASIQRLIPILRRLDELIETLTALLRKLGRPADTSWVSGKKAAGPDAPGGSVPAMSPHSADGTDLGWQEGDPIPPPLDGGGVPADLELGAQYVGEDDSTNPDRAFYPMTVHYMTDAEREACRLFVDGEGRLRCVSDGSLFDTRTAVTSVGEPGWAIFVMDEHGNLYSTLTAQAGQTCHSSFLGGVDVSGAGEIEVSDGRLVSMNDRSGHYGQYWSTANERALDVLDGQGLQKDSDFKHYDHCGDER